MAILDGTVGGPGMPTPREAEPTGAGQGPPADLGHPRGTLAIVALFGLLFGLGWVAFYVLAFLGRGAPHP
jgi:hypothetical protein